MNQSQRSQRAVREDDKRRRKTRQTRPSRQRRLVLEALEDRRLLTGWDPTGGAAASYEYVAPASYEYPGPDNVNLQQHVPYSDLAAEPARGVPAAPPLPERVSASTGTAGEVMFFGEAGNRNDVVLTIAADGCLQHNLGGRFGFASPRDLDSAADGVQSRRVGEIGRLSYLDRDGTADDSVTIDAGQWDLGAGSLAIRAGTITIAGQVQTRQITLDSTGLSNLAAGGLLAAYDGGDGGRIEIAAQVLVQTGQVHADGAAGGRVRIAADRVLSSAAVSAGGQAGAGGQVEIEFAESYVGTVGAVVSADGTAQGGRVRISGGDTGRLFTSGNVSATGADASASGGTIELLGRQLVLIGAAADASGPAAGGRILVGGDRGGRNPAIPNARTVETSGVTLRAAGRVGGTIVVWSDEATEFGGSLSTAGRVGGMIEVSSPGELVYAGTADAGPGGTLLLDPKNLVVDEDDGMLPQFDLINPTPASGDNFGINVLPLSTGNVVVTDPGDDFVATDAGAAYLYDGLTGELLSALTGSASGDGVGVGGARTLGNGNYVLLSRSWNNGAGAATWGSGTTGVSGVVSSSNSLIGSSSSDRVGDLLTILSNGNYLVHTPSWDNGAAANAGAVTWGSGTAGVSGVVSSDNSLVGFSSDDGSGSGVLALNNGNYVVYSPNWDNGAAANAGAVTWGSGTTGVSGVISSDNSLVGSVKDDSVGYGATGIIALSNGNYVVRSPYWDNTAVEPTAVNAGAATWASGTTGIHGLISGGNSLVGSQSEDYVGWAGVPLANGNYVVASRYWDNGSTTDAGAVTWGDGTTGVSGAVTSTNSLVGSSSGDQVGFPGVVSLSNGSYVVLSQSWDNGSAVDAGAATWGSGTGGVNGVVSSTNSLVGSTSGDNVGSPGAVVSLNNGNYVVRSPSWDNATVADVGAVTWGNGTTGVSGAISGTNSLIGSTSGDQVGYRVEALSNGNYVARTQYWDNGTATNAGAVTWCSGAVPVSGAVDSTNSLVGSTSGDQVGLAAPVPLSNGNFVIASRYWDNGSAADAGAVTWGDGTTGLSGPITSGNSLVGSSSNDQVGSGGVWALQNGNYVVLSFSWKNGSAANAGAATWGSGTAGVSGEVTSGNSLVGSTSDDKIGSGGLLALSNGNYVVRSQSWDNGPAVDAGAATWGSGTAGVSGAVSSGNSLVGSTSSDQIAGSGVLALSNGNYLVVSPSWHNGSAASAGAATWGSGATGISGMVSAKNSLVGRTANAGLGTAPMGDSVNNTFLARFSSEGSGGRVTVGFVDPNQLTFARGQLATITIPPGRITGTTNLGTAVTLQASNDLTVNSPVVADNPAGAAGNLTLQAGRSLVLNANLTTDNANLTLIANDTVANGVVDAKREAGEAVLTMAAGTQLDVGSGTLTVALRNSTDKTYNARGVGTLQDVTAASTVLNDGTVLANGTISGPVTVNSGAVLGGIGTTGAVSVQAGGTLAPGAGPGILHSSDLTFQAGATFAVEIGGNTPGNAATNHDQQDVAGTVTISTAAPGVTLSVSAFNGYVPQLSDAYVLINNDGSDAVTGTFAGLPEGAVFSAGFLGTGLPAVLTYQGGSDGNDVVLIVSNRPLDLSLSPTSVVENQPVGTVVGVFTTTDPDLPLESHTYTLVSGPGDTDNGSFTIAGDQLLTAAVFDYETMNSYSIRVRTTDAGGLWYEEQFTISVIDVDDTPPTVTVASLVTDDRTPAITGTLSDGTLQVAVNGKTYTAGDQNLTVSGTDWTLQIPTGDALHPGAYDVVATATDTAGNVGSDTTTDELGIVGLIVTSLTPTLCGFVVQFSHPFQLADLNLYDGAAGALGPADIVLADGSGQAVAGSMIVADSLQAIEFFRTGSVLAPGTYTVTVRSGADALRDADGYPLDGNQDGRTGDDYTGTFTVAASSSRVVSIPDMARGAAQPVNIPNTAFGLPVRIDNAAGVTSLAVDLVYAPSLLTVTAAALAAGVPGDWSVGLDTSTPGVARITATGSTGLAGTNIDVVRLTAAVPANAPYGALQAIRLENVKLNGGSLAAVGDVAVHKAAYLGDADGSGRHSSADAFLTVQAALGLASGFAAHAWSDPRLVGDADGSGLLSAADAFLIVQEGLGLSEPFVPDNPLITVTPVGGGVDPQFQIGADLAPSADDGVTVPVNLAIEPAATNVGAIDFDLRFDPARLTIQLPGGFSAGADTVGWAMSATLIAPGQLRVRMVSASGRPLAVGLRQIARLQLHVAASFQDATPVSERPGYVVALDIEPVDPRAGGYTWTAADGKGM